MRGWNSVKLLSRIDCFSIERTQKIRLFHRSSLSTNTTRTIVTLPTFLRQIIGFRIPNRSTPPVDFQPAARNIFTFPNILSSTFPLFHQNALHLGVVGFPRGLSPLSHHPTYATRPLSKLSGFPWRQAVHNRQCRTLSLHLLLP